MLAIERPELRPAGLGTRGNQRVGHLQPMALSVLPKISTGPASGICVNWSAGQSTKEIAKSVVFTGSSSRPKFSHADRRVHHRRARVAQFNPSGNDLRFSAAR